MTEQQEKYNQQDSTEKPGHWTEDQKARRAILDAARRRGIHLNADTVEEIFGIRKLGEFDGSLHDAIWALDQFAARREQELYEAWDMECEAPQHAEAKVIAFSDLVTPNGQTVRVTAREGATPEMIASTVLALSLAGRLLEPLGYKPTG